MASLINPCRWGLDQKPCYSQVIKGEVLCEQHQEKLELLLDYPKEIVRGKHG